MEPIDVEQQNEEVVGVAQGAQVNVPRARKRHRKQTSEVWSYFDRLPIGDDGLDSCKCKKCGVEYKGASKYGTGNMKRHLASCVKNSIHDIGQMISSNGSLKSVKFSQETFREMLIHAIIKHDLPFQFVEYEGIEDIFSYLSQGVAHITRNTAKSDVLKLHSNEIIRLRENLVTAPGRICLTSDLWTSIITDGYLSLTAHFIDKDWVLQNRILNFSHMPPPHSGVALADKVHGLLSYWGIEKKLFSITLDNASSNNVFVELLKDQLCLQDALLADGSFFHIRCCAHILNLIVQEGLKEIDGCIDKARECVKYVKGSQARKQKFLDCVGHVSLDSAKALRQDVPTRWNSTYLMLVSVIYYRRAFCHLQLSDSNFKHCPTHDEWSRMEKICNFLEIFYRITCIFSGTKYPTSNLYFPQVFLIELTLSQGVENTDAFLRKMAKQMVEKFEKYWTDYSLILAIAVIFDPRYKIQFVEFSYNKLYGEGSAQAIHECANVREKLFSLFDEYMRLYAKPSNPNSMVSEEPQQSQSFGMDHDAKCMDVLKEFDIFESQEFVTTAQKSQLQLYLDEPRVERVVKCDVLTFWKANQFRYPELAQMARDILSIPISTVASESAFSVGGRVLDHYRSSLKPNVVEALICTRDWLISAKDTTDAVVDELTEEIIKLNLNKE